MQIALKRTNIYFLQSHVRPYIGCFFHNILQRKSRKFRENWHHTANKGQIWDSDKLLDSRALLSPCTTPSLSKHERVKWQAASYHQLMGFWPGLTHPRFPSENLGSQKNLGLWFFCFLAMAVPPILYSCQIWAVFGFSDGSQNDSPESVLCLYPTLK